MIEDESLRSDSMQDKYQQLHQATHNVHSAIWNLPIIYTGIYNTQI